MSYVYKIVKGNIYYCDEPIELSVDKIKRYSKRLANMGVMFARLDNMLLLL